MRRLGTTTKASMLLAAVFVIAGSSELPRPHGRAVVSAQTVATGNVMRQKLGHTQRILEALMTSDYAELERNTTALSRATESAGWWVLQSPEYRLQSSAFLRATQDLVEAARRRDLDAAATYYGAMTLRCYECHRFMKNARIAGPQK